MKGQFWAWLLIGTCVLSAASSLFVALYAHRLTGSATAQVSFCINVAPQIIVPCNTTLRQNVSVSCQLLVLDSDNDTWVFNNTWITNTTLFNATTSGLISFTPNQSHVGDHSVNLSVNDQRNCTGSVSTKTYSFTVTNVNDPPRLVKDLPATTVAEARAISAFFLNDYFSDADGDAMTYTVSITQSLNVTIRSSSQVLVTGKNCPQTEYAIFTATDTFNAQGDSNVVQLACEELATSSTTSTSDAEANKSTLDRLDLEARCQPKLQCGDWGPCGVNGLQSKSCTDAKGCREGTVTITRTCVYEASCLNNYRDALELGVDCGGPCPPCPSCDDGLQNQDETDVDCGGACGPCRYSKVLYVVYETGAWVMRRANLLDREDVTVVSGASPGGGAWSRNGSHYAYGDRGSLWLAEAGKDPVQLVSNRPFPVEWPSWSRKGPLVYAARSPITSVLHWLDMERHEDRVLAPSLAARTPAIAPDAGRIAFATGDYGFRQAAPGTPTGAAVAEPSQIYLVNDKGEILQKVSDGNANHYAPSFSADGKSLAYFVDRDGNTDLWILDLETQQRRRLTETPEDEVYPVWSDDNLRIMFAANYDGNFDLYTIFPDGSGLDKVSEVSLITIPYDWYTHPTCFDEERDQNETGVDCGGPCLPCSSCFDGQKNGREAGIDCGGPCAPCYVEIPQRFTSARTILINLGVLSGLWLVLWALYRLCRPQLHRRWHALQVRLGRRRRKLALLDDAAKGRLLGLLADLENRIEAGVLRGTDLSSALSLAAREYFAGITRLSMELTPAEFSAWLQKRELYPELQAILNGFFSKVYRIEVGTAGVTEAEQVLVLEELRSLVFLTAQVLRRDIVRQVREVHPEAFVGEMDRAHALLTEAVIALGFGELQAAFRKFLAAKLSLARLRIQNRAALNEDISRVHREILYAESLVAQEPK